MARPTSVRRATILSRSRFESTIAEDGDRGHSNRRAITLSAQREAAPKRRSSKRATKPAVKPANSAAPKTNGATVVQEAPKSPAIQAPPRLTRQEAKRQAAPSQVKKPWERVIASERTEGIRKLARETYSETKKIIWPSQEETRNLVIVVIGISVFLGLLLGGIDYVLYQIFQALP
jgi:preprotein translocase subunit SecE